MLKKILDWDRDLFVFLNSLGIEEFDIFWSTVTNISTWIPLFILFFVLIYMKFSLREMVVMTLTVILLVVFVVFATDLTKEYVARLRPNNTEEINTLIRILKSPTNYSFFSGHAASSFSVTTLMYLFLRKHVHWAWLFYIWPFIFAFSRIYVGVHYPIDILVGAGVGIGSGYLFYWVYQRFIVPYLMSVRPV